MELFYDFETHESFNVAFLQILWYFLRLSEQFVAVNAFYAVRKDHEDWNEKVLFVFGDNLDFKVSCVEFSKRFILLVCVRLAIGVNTF